MKKLANQYFGAFVVTLGAVSYSQAQEPPAIMVDISSCVELPSRDARGACYEALADAALAARATAVAEVPVAANGGANDISDQPAEDPVSNAPARDVMVQQSTARNFSAEDTTAREATDSAVVNFGTTPAQAPSVVEGAEGQAELHDRITDLQEREPGRWLITLASGQVWYQSNSARLRLRRNMDVRIYPSPLGGSFRLAGVDGNTGFIQVTRVK